MNYLKAVFWDYPKFADEKYLKKFVRGNRNNAVYKWVMTRFVAHGRVVDTLRFFPIREISRLITKLRISSYSKRKWKRILEVYDKAERK
ncbi:MAG: hypothetical protein ABIJ15_00075 [bacterium]